MCKQILNPDPDIAGAALRGLALAVLLHCAQEARAGDTEAAAWLASDGCIWVEMLGLVEDPDPEAPARFLHNRRSCERLMRAFAKTPRPDKRFRLAEKRAHTLKKPEARAELVY